MRAFPRPPASRIAAVAPAGVGRREWRTWGEVLLALAAGVAAFAVTALAGTAARSRLPEAVFVLLLVAGVALLARCTGILFALPVGTAAVLALDWYFLPPLRALDPTTVLVLGAFLLTSVVVGEAATRARRRAATSEQSRGALAAEQGALRRVATLVAASTPAEKVYATVVAEVGRLLGVDFSVLLRYEPEGSATVVDTWTRTEEKPPASVGTTLELGGRNVTSEVFATRSPARMDDYAHVTGALGDLSQGWGFRSAVGVPVDVDGRPWGVMIVAYTHGEPLPADTERRLTGFTELISTAISTAQARLDLRGYAEEQGALRRVATLVARAAPPSEVFATVSAEVGRVLGADVTTMVRYDADGEATFLATWTRTPGASLPPPPGSRVPTDGRSVASRVLRTGRPARTEDYAEAPGAAVDVERSWGLRALVGVPISVDGRLWGLMTAASTHEEHLPADYEARLAAFTELVASAVGNAEAQAALTASRARIVATADSTRRRFERDLHDGAQQRLVSLALHLRGAVRAAVPPEAGELTAHLDAVAGELTGVLEELREIARGLHPATLAAGGLRPALRTLARRSAVPVRLDVRLVDPLPDQVELAAYYVVAEALTNAAKHAKASVVDVEVSAGESALRVCVRDDGRGGADVADGSGLVGLSDRVEALGGRLLVASPVGVGTRLNVTIPVTAGASAEQPEADA
jgi:signal transduction histidine kinase